MNKKWMILTCFFSILTLISSIICTCLVFYNEKARTDINSNKVLASNYIYKSTLITYNQNNKLNIIGISPGYSLEQHFSITNNNSDTIKYDIVWQNINSNWLESPNNDEDFLYTLSCSDGQVIEKQKMPVKNSSIIKNQELKTNKINECTIKIEFLNKGNNQFYSPNNSYNGEYKVIIKE